MRNHGVLFLLMLLVLTGCGKGEETPDTAEKEWVYVPEFVSMEDEAGGSMEQITVTGDNICYISSEYVQEAKSDIRYLCTWKADGTEPVKTRLDIGNDTTVSKLAAAPDGNLLVVLATRLHDEAAREENDGERTEDETGDAVANEEIKDGNEKQLSQKIEICKMSMDGKIISLSDVTDNCRELENSGVEHAQTDGKGNIYLCGASAVVVLDKNGKKLFAIESDYPINDMFSTKDGVVLVSFFGKRALEVHSIDTAAKDFGVNETGLLSGAYDEYVFAGGYDTDLLFCTGNELYTYNLGDSAPVKLLNLIDCDINATELQGISVLDDGRILAVTSSAEGEGSKTEMVYLTQTERPEAEERTILTYAAISIDNNEMQKIINFNKNNREYRIEVKDYATKDGVSGWEQLDLDIISGNGPDILCVTCDRRDRYARLGLLEDLNPYLDADPELSRKDYLENILKAFETDGKLYGISERFYFTTVLAKVSDVGERKSITIKELMELSKNLPKGKQLYENAANYSVLMRNVMMSIGQFVDWSSGECSFNGDEFIELLQFSNTFEDNYEYSEDAPDTATLLHEGKFVMLPVLIDSVQKYQMMEAMFGEPIAFVGYPADGTVGSYISDGAVTAAISTRSKNKEGAWQFIRRGFTKEAQEDPERNGDGFPIMKSALEAQFQWDMMDEYYEMPDGTKEKRPKASWEAGNQYGSPNLDIYAASEEQVAAVRDMVYSLDSLYQYDEKINSIIMEESQAYFAGQNTAQETAELIQNRVQLYVDENR